MKYIVTVAISLIACQSQASKDREEMEQLLVDRERLERQTLTFKVNQITETGAIDRAYYDFVDSLHDQTEYISQMHLEIKALREKDSLTSEVEKKYNLISKSTRDSLRTVEKRIETLRLLMGK